MSRRCQNPHPEPVEGSRIFEARRCRPRPFEKLRARSRGSVALVGVSSSLFLATPALADIKGDREFGAYLSSECLACHQLSGRAVGAIPPIVGLPAESFVALMNAYRRKERENETMRVIAAKFGDEEIAALAVYFESVRPKP